MLVIPDYEELSSSWGVEGKPIFRGGFWCMPLGWEERLTELGIDFQLKEITYFREVE